MAVCSFAHYETALSLQAGYSDNQIGAFEDFHQPVEDTLIVLRPGPQVFFQYELRFVDRHEEPIVDQSSVLTQSNKFSYPSNKRAQSKNEQEIKPLLGNIPDIFMYSINFCFNAEPASQFDTACKMGRAIKRKIFEALDIPMPEAKVICPSGRNNRCSR